MPWPIQRLPPLLCLLPGALAALACGSAPASGLDGVALVQMDYGPRRQSALSQAARAKPTNDVEVNMDSLMREMNETSMSATIFSLGPKDSFTMLMRFINILLVAVKKESFMKAVNDMSRSTSKVVADFKDRSAALRADFDEVLAGNLRPDQVAKVAGDYFVKEARLLSVYFDKRKAINLKSLRSMPPDAADCISQLVNSGASQDTVAGTKAMVAGTRAMTVDTSSQLEEYCSEVGGLMHNLTVLETGMKRSKQLVNGTQRVTPMLKNYLVTLKPELVPRMLWVLNALLDMTYDGADAIEGVTTEMAGSMAPALHERLRCPTEQSGSRPKFRLGLLVGLLLAARSAWAVEEGLGR